MANVILTPGDYRRPATGYDHSLIAGKLAEYRSVIEEPELSIIQGGLPYITHGNAIELLEFLDSWYGALLARNNKEKE